LILSTTLELTKAFSIFCKLLLRSFLNLAEFRRHG